MAANPRTLKNTAPAKSGKSAAPRAVKNEPATGLDRLIHERLRLGIDDARLERAAAGR